MVDATVKVSVLVVSVVSVAGANATVTPVGAPVEVNVTVPAPFARVIVMGTVAAVPCTALAVPPPAEMVIAGVAGAGTVSAYETV